MVLKKYTKLFFSEADEKINDLNKALLGLEKRPQDARLANDAMRAAHTLKSSAAAMEYMGISHLAHAMEDLFEQVRTRKHKLEQVAIDLLFSSVDALSSAVKAIKDGKPEPDKIISDLRLRIADLQRNPKFEKSESINLKSEIIEPIEAIKVEVETIDKLMSLTEELLVEKMRLSEIVKRVESGSAEIKDSKSEILNLKSSNESFNRLISELQFHVTEVRMVPLGQILERFPRMVRDLAREQKKAIDFQMEGQDIELDRTVIDRMGEPLIHLVRNAVDHGIIKSGTIKIKARRERDQVIIEVENDGSAIDWGRVVETAVRKGIVTGEKAEELSADLNITNPNSEIINLLFHPQLSTKDKVTETSGRGIGLFIVKSVIESFGGAVSVESPVQSVKDSGLKVKENGGNPKSEILNLKSQGGTRFRLELPLTLAIIQALLVRVADQVFALPFSQIDRSVRVPATQIKKAFDSEIAVVEEEDIPMVRLSKIFKTGKESIGLFISEEAEKEASFKFQAELMVITKRENTRIAGLVIDELIAEQDIVVKPLQGALRQTKGFAGITLLGDGKPALILDVATLI